MSAKNSVRIEGQSPCVVNTDSELAALLTGLFLGAGLGMERAAQTSEELLARLPESGEEVTESLPDGRTFWVWTESRGERAWG